MMCRCPACIGIIRAEWEATSPYAAMTYEERLAYREEARHSDIPKGMVGALKDRHPFIRFNELWKVSWQAARDQDLIRCRLALYRSLWNQPSTTQLSLSSID